MKLHRLSAESLAHHKLVRDLDSLASILVEAGPAILKNLKKQFPEKTKEIEELATHDPSGDKYSYLEWMWKQVRSGAKAEEVSEKITTFHAISEQFGIPFQGIKNLKDLDRVLQENGSKLLDVRTKQGYEANKDKDPVLIYDKGGYKVLEVFKHDDVCELGQDTTWCVRLKDANYFRDYNTPGTRWLFLSSPSGERRMALIRQKHGQSNKDAKIEQLRNEAQTGDMYSDHDVVYKDWSRKILDELGFVALYGLDLDDLKGVVKLMKSGIVLPERVLRSLARNKSIGNFPEVVKQLSQSNDVDVLYYLAENPSIGSFPEVVEQLSQSDNVYVIRNLAENPAIGNVPEVVKQLAQSNNDHVLRHLAQNKSIGNFPEVAKQLAQSNNDYVLWHLAANPSIGNVHEVVKQLSESNDLGVLENLAQNPSIGSFPEAIKLLSKRTNDYVLRGLAQNRAIENFPEIVKQLAQSKDEFVRWHLDSNKSPKVREILKQLKQNPQASYFESLASLLR